MALQMAARVVRRVFSIHAIIQLIGAEMKGPLASNVKTHKTEASLYVKAIEHTNTP